MTRQPSTILRNIVISLTTLIATQAQAVPKNDTCSKIILRGFNVDLTLKPQDFDYLQKINTNAIRVSLAKDSAFTETGSPNYQTISKIDAYIRESKSRNIYILLDFHNFPGNKKTFSGTPDDPIWKDHALRTEVERTYKLIAERYKTESTIAGYDLVNEASPKPQDIKTYYDFVNKIASAIKETSPNKTLVLQPTITTNKNGIASAQHENWEELLSFKDLGIIPSIHFYDPGSYTHQGLHNFPPHTQLPLGLRSKHTLDAYFEYKMGKINKFDNVIIGEFSTSNYSPEDSLLYTERLINYFESRNWNWFYHAFREAPIWDPEKELHQGDFIYKTDSKKMMIIKEFLSRNRQHSDCNSRQE